LFFSSRSVLRSRERRGRRGNALEVIDLVEELGKLTDKKKEGGRGKGGFSHLEIRADYGRVSA